MSISRLDKIALPTVLFLLTASLASAQTCTGFLSQLNAPNTALQPYLPASGSFGTVCVTLNDSNTASIVYTANSGFLFGGTDALAANINAPGAFTAGVTAVQFPGKNVPDLTIVNPPGTSNIGGQGDFNAVVVNFDGYGYAFQTGTITVDLSTGTFAGANSVLAFNANGRDAAAHIFVCGDAACTTAGGAPATGFVGETTSAVPEPSSVALFAGVLLFTGARLRKRFAQ